MLEREAAGGREEAGIPELLKLEKWKEEGGKVGTSGKTQFANGDKLALLA